ncbi:hypothetical protein niasHT_027603 [Heterodera trifolii]|uniref:BUB1 N-terminal domain-containing protein n=1 Tax=Heterodera trifolii TaxID=157864 RepID=A0ABD2K592_9BILA
MNETGNEDWFDNVENLRPIRGGRRADTLNDIATGKAKISIERAEQKFLTEFANASKGSDPLEPMYRFTIWFEEHFPSGKQKHFCQFLYKICTTYCLMNAYKNDDRLMKLWLKLTENFPESGFAIMEFAFSKGSCRQLAKFYIHWSTMYQSISWWNKAREKLQLGQKMCAMPLDLLHRAVDELEASVMKVTRSGENSEETEADEMTAVSLEQSRETLGKLRGLGRRHFAPIIRTAQGPPGTLSTSKRNTSSKNAKNNEHFEILADEFSECVSLKGVMKIPFQTPIGTRMGKKSFMAESLRFDQDYQTLFGTFDTNEKVDLQITNEENELNPNEASKSRLPNIAAHTPAQPIFEIFREEGDEDDEQPRKTTKSKLKLRKELIKTMSIEEGFAQRISNDEAK